MNRDIKAEAKKLIKKYGTNNPIELCDYLNILLQWGDLGDVLGCYLLIKRQRCIMINESLRGTTQEKIVAGHELGHAILHRNNECYFYGESSFFVKNKPEIEANIFAAHLLIEDDLIKSFPGYTEEQFCKCTGYPKELITLRFNSNK